MNKKEKEECNKSFIEWCFSNANDFDKGRFELAKDVWFFKEEEILKLKKKLEEIQCQKNTKRKI